jgi:hypothetical protein
MQCRLTPVEVCDSGTGATCDPLTGATAVVAGGSHTCALVTDGAVKCWGQNASGQLGDGTFVHPRLNPVEVCLIGFGAGCSGAVPLTGAVALSAGRVYTCALMTGGGVKCWGDNFSGQLGDGTTFRRANPVDVCATGADTNCTGGAPLTGVTSIATGFEQSCATLSGGGLRCWGWNGEGQLGDGTTTSRNRPVNVCASGSGGGCPALGDVSAAGTGAFHTCAVVSGGGVKCWGMNAWGQLGDGSTVPSLLPIDTGLKVTDSDGDGCTDPQELGNSAASGGRRDPNWFWDFFDVPTGVALARDRAVTAGDILSVAARFGSNDATPGEFDRNSNPLSVPNAAISPPAVRANYHPAYERGGPMPGQEPWDLLPANGSIAAGDIASVVAQFGHSCA